MAQKESRVFYFENEYNSFYPGETIKGKIHFIPVCKGQLNDIEISFNLAENWLYLTDYAGYGSNISTIATFNLNIKKLLNESKDYIELTEKEYVFPFEYRIPINTTASFEFPTLKYKAFRRFILSAKLISPTIYGNTSTYVIVKAPPKEQANNVEVEQSLAIKKWGLFKQGNTKLKVLSSPSFGFNQPISVKVNIDNSESKLKVKECKIVFMRHVIFKDDTNAQKHNSEEYLAKKKFPAEVKKHETKQFDFKIELNEIKNTVLSYSGYFNPYNKEKQCQMIYTPSCEGTIIECQYALKITAYYDSFVKKKQRPRIILPINIAHQSDENPPFVIGDNYDEELKGNDEESKKEEEKQKSANDQSEAPIGNNNNNNKNININDINDINDVGDDNNNNNKNINNINQAKNMYPSFDDNNNKNAININNNNNDIDINSVDNDINNNNPNNKNVINDKKDHKNKNNNKFQDINKIGDSDNDDSDGDNFNIL